MTRDDFLAGLRADWRGEPLDPARIRLRTDRRRMLIGFYGALGLVGSLGALLLGLWFGWRAWADRDPIVAVAAVALLVSAPVLLAEYLEWRRERDVRYGDTPRDVLLQARKQLEFSRRLQSGCRWCALILGSGAAAVLALMVTGVSADAAGWRVVAAWSAAAALVWGWSRWRYGRLERERAQCERLIAELYAADD